MVPQLESTTAQATPAARPALVLDRFELNRAALRLTRSHPRRCGEVLEALLALDQFRGGTRSAVVQKVP